MKEYIKNNPKIKDFFNNEDFEIKDLSVGINEIFFLSSSKTKQKTIIKKALPYFKQTPNELLAQNRIFFEANSLEIFALNSPSFVPKIYFEDKNNHLIALEFLENTKVLNTCFQEGKVFENLSSDIGIFLSTTAFKTSEYFLNKEEKDDLINFYNQNKMKEVSISYIFDALIKFITNTNGKIDTPTNALFMDISFNKNRLLENTQILKQKFINTQECLIHGDFKGGAILLNEKNTYFIDFEFSSFGAMAYDLASIFHLFVCMSVNYDLINIKREYKFWLLEQIEKIWNEYKNNFIFLWKQKNKNLSNQQIEELFSKILKDIVGFLGVHILSLSIPFILPIDENLTLNQAFFELEIIHTKTIYKIAKVFILDYENFSSIEQIIKVVQSNFRN